MRIIVNYTSYYQPWRTSSVCSRVSPILKLSTNRCIVATFMWRSSQLTSIENRLQCSSPWSWLIPHKNTEIRSANLNGHSRRKLARGLWKDMNYSADTACATLSDNIFHGLVFLIVDTWDDRSSGSKNAQIGMISNWKNSFYIYTYCDYCPSKRPKFSGQHWRHNNYCKRYQACLTRFHKQWRHWIEAR